jgi:hypothetical protein
MEKYCSAEQAADNNMAHVHCMLDTAYKYTHTDYVILISVPLQQRLHECATALRYTYLTRLVSY